MSTASGKHTIATSDDEQHEEPKGLARTNPQKRLKPSSSDPVAVALAHARSKVALLVHPNQLRNPMLRHIRHVRKQPHNGITADFVCGPTTCALYLSLQFHRLHPDYIYKRVRALGTSFKLRILLVLVDVADHRASLHELTKMCLINSMTIICTGSEREAARYLETFQSYDGKGADSIQERVANDYASKLNAALSSVRGINRTDVNTLAFTFGSFRGTAEASREELRQCPGIGERKVSRLFQALHQPFQGDWKEMDEDQQEDFEGEVP
ncbi:DNA excision repair protein ERCC-1 [Gracilariopsis chorda]|uniref:DNA excision repair protein ERCC-1 n=1 Tax=Gracilariopsis chorda TaxID=448386 RepID=A0A2V3IH71_9FLOR|nr:DNA excision repair protein ERCC-1 [Gracilariopsis chorda]|eukprot:PXF41434.1 DNA excision repair protein ERCC-1 [Gracilariopsis chorda]